MANDHIKRGVRVPCLICGETDCIRIDADDVDVITCTECDAEFSREEARDTINAWAVLLDWLDTAPARG
jgi:uncharacterized protein (DUF983 family)